MFQEKLCSKLTADLHALLEAGCLKIPHLCTILKLEYFLGDFIGAILLTLWYK